jgi:hypothetical protein
MMPGAKGSVMRQPTNPHPLLAVTHHLLLGVDLSTFGFAGQSLRKPFEYRAWRG